MRKSKRIWITVLLSLLALAGSAQAERIVGWDFSQYATAGRLTINGSTFVNTLDPNYTDLGVLTLYGFGSKASVLGSMVMDGTLGSTSVSPSPGSDVVPTPRSATRGYSETAYSGAIQGNVVGFDAFGILKAVGQANTEFLGLLANAPATVVFEADLTPLGQTAENWSVLFGGETLGGASTVSVGLDVGCDGTVDVGPSVVNLDATTGATTQAVSFPGLNTNARACVQFGMAAGSVIDNVSIEATPVPEPGMLMMLSAGVSCLIASGRARARA